MKKTILIMAVLILSGCAAASSNTIPQGKTDADWEWAEQYCLGQSKLITGFFAFNPVAGVLNFERREKYKQCLIDTGWLVEEKKQAQK